MEKIYDCIIVGAGLSGLTCGLSLQKKGLKTLILERRAVPGGLCGHFESEGYTFVIACNDFGQGMRRLLKELRVPIRFENKQTWIFYQGKRWTLPPTLKSFNLYARQGLDFIRFAKGLRAYGRRKGKFDLESFAELHTKGEKARDLLKLPAYLMGVSPRDFKVDEFFYEAKFRYGYARPTVPAGGPKALSSALVEAFRKAGGELLCSSECTGIDEEGGMKRLSTTGGSLVAKTVVSTAGREGIYPPGSRPGLPLSMICIAVEKSLQFPAQAHTLLYYPPHISNWFGKLEDGTYPEEFGFHLFKGVDQPEKHCYTINLYFYLPRGEESPPIEHIDRLKEYLFSRAESLLPGLQAAMLYHTFISPRRFEEIHGLSSRVTPMITPSGTPKFANYDPALDIYYAGNSVFPPGDHAGAAVLSGKLVADQVRVRLSKQGTDTFGVSPCPSRLEP